MRDKYSVNQAIEQNTTEHCPVFRRKKKKNNLISSIMQPTNKVLTQICG